eukprot:CAMPEP_0195526490 /NCGR_PEP_ID=MMETSP0794_2-20130614/27588_1 /TAXON_ID=515487 /ORGANISM="Stephanopyxis turris, Strain CCMP 815" /LENGTH=393 /DNA_ID=CAMNT_0040657187 /DNA_START=175 /DNA_END=1356 /DNA_ORIENTATION=+
MVACASAFHQSGFSTSSSSLTRTTSISGITSPPICVVQSSRSSSIHDETKNQKWKAIRMTSSNDDDEKVRTTKAVSKRLLLSKRINRVRKFVQKRKAATAVSMMVFLSTSELFVHPANAAVLQYQKKDRSGVKQQKKVISSIEELEALESEFRDGDGPASAPADDNTPTSSNNERPSMSMQDFEKLRYGGKKSTEMIEREQKLGRKYDREMTSGASSKRFKKQVADAKKKSSKLIVIPAFGLYGGVTFLRQRIRRSREKVFVAKNIEKLEIQKQEFFNVTGKSESDDDLMQQLKDAAMNSNVTLSEEDGEEGDDEDDEDGGVVPSASSDRPKKPSGGDSGSGSSGSAPSSSTTSGGGIESSSPPASEDDSSGGDGGLASDDDVERMKRMFGKS